MRPAARRRCLHSEGSATLNGRPRPGERLPEPPGREPVPPRGTAREPTMPRKRTSRCRHVEWGLSDHVAFRSRDRCRCPQGQVKQALQLIFVRNICWPID